MKKWNDEKYSIQQNYIHLLLLTVDRCIYDNDKKVKNCKNKKRNEGIDMKYSILEIKYKLQE